MGISLPDKPERAAGIVDDKPGTFPIHAIFHDGYSGDIENFPGQEQAHAGIPPHTPLKDPHLVFGGNSSPVILADDK